MGRKVRAVGLPLLLCSGLLLSGRVTQTLDAQVPAASLGVILTAAPGLSTVARTALFDEATKIWDKAGVRLEWSAWLAPRPLPIDTLRVLAVARPAWHPRGNTSVLGELLRFDASKAIARVSLADAERIVSRGRLRAGALSDQRVGIILGRAAAHEIGHYLLDTSTHAPDGLMRATFDEREFADLRSDAFDLDEQASAWVQQRLAQGLPLGPAAAVSATAHASAHVRFSYAQ